MCVCDGDYDGPLIKTNNLQWSFRFTVLTSFLFFENIEQFFAFPVPFNIVQLLVTKASTSLQVRKVL